MPPRKSDQQRKSDVSVARFILADEESPAPQSPAPVAVAPSTSASATPAATAARASQPPSEKKEKEKEKEKDKDKDKDKEKEKDKDKDGERRDTAISIEDLQLPKSIVTRLAKGVLPPNTQIQANAILAMSKSATVFINHLANAANEVTTIQNKKTIMPADVFRGLEDIEFGFMRERVEAEFAKFNEVQTSKRTTYRKKVAAAKKGPAGADGADASAVSLLEGDTTMNDSALASGADTSMAEQPRSKKARTDDAGGGAFDSSRMELDEDAHDHDPSDAETVPDDVDEDEDEDDDAEEEEEEEDDDEEDAADEERDDVEDRENGPDEDEALDDGNDSE